MACRHEHNECSGGHGHGHGPGGHDHGDDNDPEVEQMAAKDSLFSVIDVPKVRALNEHSPGACKTVFKPYHERLDTTKFVKSDADEELIIFIPFTQVVRLRAIAVIGGNNGEAPSKMRVYINREDIDFDKAHATQPIQEWELAEDSQQGRMEYPTRYTKFTSVHSLTIHFPSNYGAAVTTIYYIGLKGETTHLTTKQVIMNAVYEASPNLKDHKIVEDSAPVLSPK